MRKLWNHLWFRESTVYQYGLFRILFLLGLIFFQVDYADLFLKTSPIFSFSVWGDWFPSLFPPSHETIVRLVQARSLFYGLVLFGICTRPSLVILTALQLYIGAYFNSFGTYNHITSIPTIVLLILCFTPAIDSYSIDALIKAKWRNSSPIPMCESIQGKRTLPVWPAHLILFLLISNYFSAGLSKVNLGNHWTSGKTLTYYLKGPVGEFYSAPPQTPVELKWRDSFGLETFVYNARIQTPLSKKMGDLPWLTKFLSIFTLLFEITFPLALLSRRWLWGYAAIATSFHLGILVIWKLNFTIYLFCFLVFIDWVSLWKRFISKDSKVKLG